MPVRRRVTGMNKDEMECPICKQLAMPKVDEEDSHEIEMERVCRFCGVSYFDAQIAINCPPPRPMIECPNCKQLATRTETGCVCKFCGESWLGAIYKKYWWLWVAVVSCIIYLVLFR